MPSENEWSSHMAENKGLAMVGTPVHRQLQAVRAAQADKPPPDFGTIISNASKRAFSGGIAGAGAMAIQVTSLMWMRTTMNYQYRYGTTMMQALRHLHQEGGGGLKGIIRFYRGYVPALAQGPLSRFGDTAANAGMLALLDSYESTKALPVASKTLCASFSAATFRIFLMPIDCLKTTMQVEGKNGLPLLAQKIRTTGPQVLWAGALASSSATFVGHFPWFYTYNLLDTSLPQPAEFMPFVGNVFAQKLLRSALMGFVSSAVSDTCSNSIRVIKTTKQTHAENISYPQAIKDVVAKDGVVGLFGRGLSTRIIANGIQGLMFSVLWKLGQDYLNAQQKKEDDKKKWPPSLPWYNKVYGGTSPARYKRVRPQPGLVQMCGLVQCVGRQPGLVQICGLRSLTWYSFTNEEV
eukprot:CAMPEP_0181300662 /NCGR_PEP_ID=MMETSP1101-20121128/7010_1 /TAXON_ID=46948 /ORGANISM="Rhodomonas abbreviata, Strain Caron Lab Isolate" /LENGTH=407 /DNA_ID=CAMNT_0023405915 /DNA_START=39 /DNA_END=1260 /DNA_ORIENTATION=+